LASTRLQHLRLTETGAGERSSAWPAREVTTAGVSSASTSSTTMASDALMLALAKMVTGMMGTRCFWGIETLGSDASRKPGPTYVG
jgi:hypothetical protein